MAKRDSSAAAYLLKIDEARRMNKKMAVNLISPRVIQVMLMTMKQMIIEKIVDYVNTQKNGA